MISLRREPSAGYSGSKVGWARDGGGNGQGLGGRGRRQGVSLGSRVGRLGQGTALSRKVENDEADILKLIDESHSRWPRRLSGQWTSLPRWRGALGSTAVGAKPES